MLADWQIEEAVVSGEIYIFPFNLDNVQPASYDLTLHELYRKAKQGPFEELTLDCRDIEEGHTILQAPRIGPDGPYILMNPRDFILASTVEEVKVPVSCSARVEGKSSIGRLGLAVHITAGFIDPGFEGHITLEIANLGPWPVKLRPGQKIAQIAFSVMDEIPRNPYGFKGHYMGQEGPVESKFKMTG